MNSVVRQIIRGIIIAVVSLAGLILFLMIGLIQTPDTVYKNDPQFLQTPIKSLGDGRFVFAITAHNPSLCDTHKKNSSTFDERNCLGNFVKSVYIQAPYVYVYIRYAGQEKINPEFFNVKAGEDALMKFDIFGREDTWSITSYDAIPNYIKIDYNSGERWIYGKKDLKGLSIEDKSIFERLENDPKLVLDGKSYPNGPYEGSDRYQHFSYSWWSRVPGATAPKPFLDN